MPAMYEWLADEMSKIKTRKFYLVDGPASSELRQAVENSKLFLPPSYREFVLKFGNARLYRRITSYSDNYLIEVYAGPRETVNDDGELLFQFGRTESSLAYFKESLAVENAECPVFEWRHEQGIRKTADGFLDWLKGKCKWARKKFKTNEWEALQHGPSPFSEQELAIVEARKDFRWRVVGIAPNGDLRFEIHNGSDMILAYLSVGIRGKLRPPKNGPLNGGGHLPVSSIHPGETKIIRHDCYKKLIAPEDTEVFDRTDWGPEDREQFWELKPVSA
jgi:hypothetical protein